MITISITLSKDFNIPKSEECYVDELIKTHLDNLYNFKGWNVDEYIIIKE